MFALISPNEQRGQFQRIAELSGAHFDVAPPMHWVDAPSGTTTDGLTSTDDWTPHRWELFALPESARDVLQTTVQAHKGAKYDWFSLLAFLLPGRWSDSKRLYCFELPALVLGMDTRQRVTPERILHAIR